nr:MAG TPA: hypothetical protein [Microviridae sp.]
MHARTRNRAHTRMMLFLFLLLICCSRSSREC